MSRVVPNQASGKTHPRRRQRLTLSITVRNRPAALRKDRFQWFLSKLGYKGKLHSVGLLGSSLGAVTGRQPGCSGNARDIGLLAKRAQKLGLQRWEP